MKSKLFGLMAVIALLGLFPSAGHALSFSFSFTGSCPAGTCTVTGEIDGLTNGISPATKVIIDSISSATFTLPSPLPFTIDTTTLCGGNCSVAPNTFTVTGGLLTAENYDATSTVILPPGTSPPFEGLWNLALGATGSSLSNGTTPLCISSCSHPVDFQDNIVSGSAATLYTPLTAGATPLPAALPLFATGLSALGLFGWRRKRKAAALTAA